MDAERYGPLDEPDTTPFWIAENARRDAARVAARLEPRATRDEVEAARAARVSVSDLRRAREKLAEEEKMSEIAKRALVSIRAARETLRRIVDNEAPYLSADDEEAP